MKSLGGPLSAMAATLRSVGRSAFFRKPRFSSAMSRVLSGCNSSSDTAMSDKFNVGLFKIKVNLRRVHGVGMLDFDDRLYVWLCI